MLARVTEPGSYQAFQHFITDAPWSADAVWRRLRAVIPEREGLLIFDGTSFPKQGTSSVGVARQYCGALGKIANCQVAVTAALWTHLHAYVLGTALYLPEEWLTADGACASARPADRTLSGKVALGVDPAAAGACERIHGDGGTGGCRIWRQSPVSRPVASAALAVCRRHLVAPHGVSRDAPSPGTTADPARPTAQTSGARGGRPDAPARRGDRRRARSMAADPVAQPPRGPTVDRGLCRHPGHASGRLPPPSARPPRFGCSPSAMWARRPEPRSISSICPRPRRCRRSCGWRINAGRSSSNIKTSRPSSASIISKDGPSPVGITMSCSPR